MNHVLYILAGFGTVMGVLALLWGLVALIGRAFVARRPAPAADAATPERTTGIPPHHLAAIAAAVAAATDGRGRIVRVAAPPHASPAWALAGREELAASHRLSAGWTAADRVNRRTGQGA